MAGNREGGFKTRDTNMKRHGKDFYRKMGRAGGLAPHPEGRGFQLMDEKKRSEAGRKGGKTSKRGKAKREAWQEYEELQHTVEPEGESILDNEVEDGS